MKSLITLTFCTLLLSCSQLSTDKPVLNERNEHVKNCAFIKDSLAEQKRIAQLISKIRERPGCAPKVCVVKSASGKKLEFIKN